MSRTPVKETFEAVDAERGLQHMIIGIEGPPGGGKTYSSLRLAAGIARVRKGPTVVIDTDNERAGRYADEFKFKHLILRPPFRPLRFREAVEQMQAKWKPAAIIIDTMSDEHEGDGGVLAWHAELVESFGGGDNQNQRAWIRPKAARQEMVRGFLQLEGKTPIILTFRARQKTKPDAKGKPQNIGWQPIAPAEITGNCDVLCLLPPNADGVPKWKTGIGEEDFILKLPKYARPVFDVPGALSEDHGEALARWALGENVGKAARSSGGSERRSPPPPASPPPDDEADDFPGSRPPPGEFKLRVKNIEGVLRETDDALLWEQTLATWMKKQPAAKCRELWLMNRGYINEASKNGFEAEAARIQAAWDARGISLGE